MADTEFQGTDDAIACYCFRLTTRDLKEAYAKTGSIQGVEELTRAGSACTGCKFIMQSLFGEIPSDQYQLDKRALSASSCKKPGSRIMKGFIYADGNLESRVSSSNATPPQLGYCDATTSLEYLLLNHCGVPVHRGTHVVKTNETFVFDTRELDLPRPFFGMFLLFFDRANNGASRFNVHWGNETSSCSTHENSSSGRPRVTCPIVVDTDFLSGPNTLYAAFTNPHEQAVPFSVRVLDIETKEEISWDSELAPFCSMWVNANDTLFSPALKQRPSSKFAFRVVCNPDDMHHALSTYFFSHNRNIDLWTVNHL